MFETLYKWYVCLMVHMKCFISHHSVDQIRSVLIPRLLLFLDLVDMLTSCVERLTSKLELITTSELSRYLISSSSPFSHEDDQRIIVRQCLFFFHSFIMIFAFIPFKALYMHFKAFTECRGFFPGFLFVCLFVCLLVSFHLSFYEREGMIGKKHFIGMSENSWVTSLLPVRRIFNWTRSLSEVAFISNWIDILV